MLRCGLHLNERWSAVVMRKGGVYESQFAVSAVRSALLSFRVRDPVSRESAASGPATCCESIFINTSHSPHLHPLFIISEGLQSLTQKNHWVEKEHFQLLFLCSNIWNLSHWNVTQLYITYGIKYRKLDWKDIKGIKTGVMKAQEWGWRWSQNPGCPSSLLHQFLYFWYFA